MNDPIYEEMDMWKLSADKRNSMTYWWPLIKDLPIPKPETKIIPVDPRTYYNIPMGEAPIPSKDLVAFHKAANEFGYPVFVRGSNLSAKHEWDETCFIESADKLKDNLWHLIEEHYLAEVPCDAIIFRKFIPMETYFTGWYHNFPINKEVRCHIENGELRCFHPYWPKEAMVQAAPKDKHWEKKWHSLSHMTKEDTIILNQAWPLVAEAFKNEGWWTCDFAKGKDGVWYLIDMALGPISFHYPGCDKAPKVRMKDGKIKDMAGQ